MKPPALSLFSVQAVFLWKIAGQRIRGNLFSFLPNCDKIGNKKGGAFCAYTIAWHGLGGKP